MSQQSSSSIERRSFLTRLNAGIASFTAMAGVAMAQESPAATPRWEPAHHAQDDWLDQLPGKHRVVFDATEPEAFGYALYFADNYIRVNQSVYGVQKGDLAVVVVARHDGTPFGFNEAMWAKYGRAFAERGRLEDPKSKMAPKTNIYNTPGLGAMLANHGATLDRLFELGVQLAVCSIATRGYAANSAAISGGNTDAVFKELTSNLVSPNARMVPAGIVTVTRAQERGYTLVG
jgi:intracellular sulfur oxidation DsrE/DsrF family protein